MNFAIQINDNKFLRAVVVNINKDIVQILKRLQDEDFAPTYAVCSQGTNRGYLLYMLASPVDIERQTAAAQRMHSACEYYMSKYFGDKSYSGLPAHSLFCEDWEGKIWQHPRGRTYSMNEILRKYDPIVIKPNWPAGSEEIFHTARHYAYKVEVKERYDWNIHSSAYLKDVLRYTQSKFPDKDWHDIEYVVRRVCSWVGDHHDKIGFYRWCQREGAYYHFTN